MNIRTILGAFQRSEPGRDSFRTNESGGIAAFALFGLITCCMIAGVTVDVSNLCRQKEHLTLAAHAAAFAGIVAVAQNKASTEAQAAILAAVEKNIPVSVYGKVATSADDVQLVRYDPVTTKPVQGTPNAVKVTLHRDESVSDPAKTSLLQLVGFDEYELEVSSVAF